VPVAQTAWLHAYNSADFSLRETLWQAALFPYASAGAIRPDSLLFL